MKVKYDLMGLKKWLKKELKSKINLNTNLNHKESTARGIKKYKEQLAGRIGSLTDYGNPFCE